MTSEPKSEQFVRAMMWPWGGVWHVLRSVHPALPFALLAGCVAPGIVLIWMSEQRPYDLWRMQEATHAPADFDCYAGWSEGHTPIGKIAKGETVRVLAGKSVQSGNWIRVARKSGGACWLDRYYWDEALAGGPKPR